MTTTTDTTDLRLARYSEIGRIYIKGADDEDWGGEVGAYDADGSEWEAPVNAILAKIGYVPAGPWTQDDDGDSLAPVRWVLG